VRKNECHSGHISFTPARNFSASSRVPNRYLLVQRNYSCGRFTTPKSKKSRRVDLSKQLRAALLELRDTRLLTAMMAGQASIADDLVCPSHAGTVIAPDNVMPRYMEPTLERAGLRRFRFHDLRHTFGSLLIQDGASLAYVKDQMGHSSIQITVDTYGHLIPGADIAWVDRLDAKTTPHQSAPGAHQHQTSPSKKTQKYLKRLGCPPGIRTPIC
jgi:integrase